MTGSLRGRPIGNFFAASIGSVAFGFFAFIGAVDATASPEYLKAEIFK